MKNISGRGSYTLLIPIKRTQRIMKLSFFILFACVSGLFATETFSQVAKVTISNKSASFREILSDIENQTDYLFVYDKSEINLDQNVSLNARNKSVAEVLNAILQNTDIMFAMEGNNVMLMKKQKLTTNEVLSIQQSGRKVSGKVIDETGEPIIGANVVVKGTTNGNITDIDGLFTLENVSENQILQISYIGYLSQEIKYGGQATLTIKLIEDSQSLDEVVVVGYGTQRKANLTGAVAQVTGDALESRPIVNIAQGLQGLVPNLNVDLQSGAPGQGSKFNIRGNATILENGGSPLVLVNNVQMDPDLINPEDIESISILKDAASAAIYGARAAYGVILITTKNGHREQKPQVSFSANGYWQSPAKKIETINSMEFLTMKDIAYQNGGGGGGYYNPKVYEYAKKYFDDPVNNSPVFYDPDIDPNKYQYCGNTNWWDEVYKKSSFSQQYNVNLVGGSERSTYYASVGFNDVDGLTKVGNDKYQKVNANLSVSSDVTKWLTVSAKTIYNYTKEQHPDGGVSEANSTAYAGISEYKGYLKNDLTPLMPVKHPDGNYAGQGSFTNPVAVQELGGNMNQKKNDLWLTGAVKITPFEGLVVNADYTFNTYNSGVRRHVRRFMDYTAVPGTEQPYPWTKTTSVSMRDIEDYYTAFNAFAEYEKSFNMAHNIKVMLGYNQEYQHTKNFYSARQDLIDNDNPSINMATGEKYTSGAESHWSINGVFMRLNYNYKHKYLFEMNGRYDGSSRFAKGDRYAFFPSFSAAWRISEEAFWSPMKSFWNDMKIRASYGSLGNQLVSIDSNTKMPVNFPYLPTYGVNTAMEYVLGGIRPVGVEPSNLVSAGFTWETVEQIDFGFDAGFLNNRLTASFDWYKRNTKDMLTTGQPLPSVLGTSVPNENAADLSTTGYELSIGWNDRLENGLSYWVRGVLSDYQGKITRFANPKGILHQDDVYYKEQKLGEIWGYSSKGLFQSDEEVANSPSQTKVWGGEWKAGDVKYEDLDGNGIIDYGDNTLSNPGDKKIIGNETPRYSFGFTGGFEYKGFDFQMFWQGIGKRDKMFDGVHFWGFTSEWDTPVKASLDYWTEDNRNAYFARPNWNQSGNREKSDRYLQNASYIRLKNVTLGYSFPKNLLNNIGIQKLRVYVVGENLLTFTKLIDSFDPETLDNMTYPITKRYSLGLNITF